jgi:hypothetical protein
MINAMPNHVNLAPPVQPPAGVAGAGSVPELKGMCQSLNQRALRLAPNCTLWARPATEGG